MLPHPDALKRHRGVLPDPEALKGFTKDATEAPGQQSVLPPGPSHFGAGLLIVLGLLTWAVSLLLFASSKTVIHEISAAILLVVGTVCVVGGAILWSLGSLRVELWHHR